MKNIFLKKIFSVLLVISLITPSLVSAQWPVTDVGNTTAQTASTVTETITTAQEVLQVLKEYGLDTIVFSLAQMAGTKMANKILNKANGGASGDSNPQSFVTNFYDFFSDIETAEFDKAISELEVSKNPYANSLARSFIREYRPGNGSGVPDPLGDFTLDQVIGPNWKDFENDASVGGWDGFLALSNPANTNIGSALIAKESIANRIENAKEIESLRLVSPGFTPQGECTLDWEEYRTKVQDIKNSRDTINQNVEQNTNGSENTNTSSSQTNPEGFTDGPTLDNPTPPPSEPQDSTANASNPLPPGLEQQLNQERGKLNQLKSELVNIDRSIPKDRDGTPLQPVNQFLMDKKTQLEAQIRVSQGLVNSLESQIGNLRGSIANTSLGLAEEYAGCLQELINNPLGLTQLAIGQAATVGFERLGEIDDWGEMLSGVFLKMFESFVQTGLSSLRADFKKQKTGVGGPEELTSRNGQTISYTDAPAIIVNMPENFQDSILNTEKEVNLLRDYLDIASGNSGTTRSIPQVMASLDQCIPGPDFRFDKRLDAYISRETKKLQRKQMSGRDEVQEARADALNDIEVSVEAVKAQMEVLVQTPTRNIPGVTTMQQQITRLPEIKQKYKEKRGQLLEKQSALGLLYKLEGDLKLSVQDLRGYVAGLPTNIPFTNAGYDRLTPAEKTILVNWAKTISGRTPSVATPVGERDFALIIVWEVWSNADSYVTLKKTEWITPVNGYSPSDNYIEEKNIIRSEYNSLGERIAIQRSIDQAQLDVNDIVAVIKKTEQLKTDCDTLKRIIASNSGLISSGETAHTQMMNVLKSKQSEFITEEIKLALDGSSILAESPNKIIPTSLGSGLNPSDDRLQIAPARTVWQVIDQDNRKVLFCSFNSYLATYSSERRVPGDPITCLDAAAWYVSSPADLTGYFYGDSFE